MKHFEFDTYVNDDRTVKVPPEVAAQIERDCPVHVIVVVPDDTEDQQWTELTTQQFLRRYADSDWVYDDLPAG
jgi:hypothetical protein